MNLDYIIVYNLEYKLPRVGSYMTRNVNVSGYAGKYKDVYLRSTLEFLYAFYLDALKTPWEYEAETLYLNSGEAYKPDFKLADKTYTEIKGDFFLIRDTERINKFKKELNINIDILTSKDIENLLKSIYLPVHDLKIYWKSVATNHTDVSGKKNPRYGAKVSKSTLDKMSIGIKEAWKRPEVRKKYMTAIKNQDRTFLKGRIKSPRVSWYCPACNLELHITETQAFKKKFCSLDCGNRITIQAARNQLIINRTNHAQSLTTLVLNWAEENKDLFGSKIKLNKLRLILNPLLDYVETTTGIKDTRSICLALGITSLSRKDLVLYLKSHIENICGTVENRNLQN